MSLLGLRCSVLCSNKSLLNKKEKIQPDREATLKAKALIHLSSRYCTPLAFCWKKKRKQASWDNLKMQTWGGMRRATTRGRLSLRNTRRQRLKAPGGSVPRAAWRQGTVWWVESAADAFRSPASSPCVACASACSYDQTLGFITCFSRIIITITLYEWCHVVFLWSAKKFFIHKVFISHDHCLCLEQLRKSLWRNEWVDEWACLIDHFWWICI